MNLQEKIKKLRIKFQNAKTELEYYENILRKQSQFALSEILEKHLTPQQQMICRHIKMQKTSAQVAKDMQISIKTVKYHLTRIYVALNCTNRSGLLKILQEKEFIYARQGITPVIERPTTGSTTSCIQQLYNTGPNSSSNSLPAGVFK
jgi:DNA-binding CsgD family transcriptional regulator